MIRRPSGWIVEQDRGRQGGPSEPEDGEAKHRRFVETLSAEEMQLLVIRDELYEGSWHEMRRDLEDRLAGKPFIFKLVNRIEEDLERIERLASYEDRESVNLGEYLE